MSSTPASSPPIAVGQAARARAGGEREEVVGERAAVGEGDGAGGAVDGGGGGAGEELDPLGGVEARRAQEQALAGELALEVGLGERRALVGRDRLGADERERAGVAEGAQAARPARRRPGRRPPPRSAPSPGPSSAPFAVGFASSICRRRGAATERGLRDDPGRRQQAARGDVSGEGRRRDPRRWRAPRCSAGGGWCFSGCRGRSPACARPSTCRASSGWRTRSGRKGWTRSPAWRSTIPS